MANTVVAKEADRPAKPIVESDEHLTLPESGAGFDLIDFADITVRTISGRISRSDAARNRRIDIAKPDYMLSLNHENAGEHRELEWNCRST